MSPPKRENFNGRRRKTINWISGLDDVVPFLKSLIFRICLFRYARTVFSIHVTHLLKLGFEKQNGVQYSIISENHYRFLFSFVFVLEDRGRIINSSTNTL